MFTCFYALILVIVGLIFELSDLLNAKRQGSVFGIFGVVYYGLIIVVCVVRWGTDRADCNGYTLFISTLATLFIFVQMHFIFCNSKITVRGSVKIARLGMMHLTATNLWIWMRYILLEEEATTEELAHANFASRIPSFSCLRTAKTSSFENLLHQVLQIFFSTDGILLLFSLVAIVLAFCRMRNLNFKKKEDGDTDESAELLDHILLVIGLVGELVFSIGGIMSLSNTTQFNYMIIILLVVQNLRLFQVILQSALLLIGSKLKAASPELKALKPGKQVRCFHNVGHIKLFMHLESLHTDNRNALDCWRMEMMKHP
uniref:Uncharacterized protein n=1 Tax=Parascaris equorum TaxID=6256 RepID=A0A914S3F8_PAREQ